MHLNPLAFNFLRPFYNKTSFTISRAEHGFATANLLVLVYSPPPDAALMADAQVVIDPQSIDVTVSFIRICWNPESGEFTEEPLPPQSGTVLITSGLVPDYSHSA